MSKTFNFSNMETDPLKNLENSSFLGSGIHIREDDQDWGSAGMNDVQEDN